MDAKQVNQTFDLVSYTSGLVTLHKSGAYWLGPCPVCGGRDRFQVKRTQSGDAWICRKCAPDKYHSVLDFLMAYHREDFKAALQRAGGEVQAPRRELGTGKPVQSPAPVQVLPDDVWQRDARQIVDRASDRLTAEEAGAEGRRYLAARGIMKGSIFSSLLGYDPAKYDPKTKAKRPAIVIPWLDMGDVITAVKYRFIDDRGKDNRFCMLGGSMPYLYGLRDILASDKTLLFVEGELNAVSVLQTRPAGVSVVSGGSEGNGNAALLQALAKHYNRAVIWTDEADTARKIRERMNRPDAKLLKSPQLDGVKYDANEMLCNGVLMEFISAELQTTCERWIADPAAIAQARAMVNA
jgi:hypothetical protein